MKDAIEVARKAVEVAHGRLSRAVEGLPSSFEYESMGRLLLAEPESVAPGDVLSAAAAYGAAVMQLSVCVRVDYSQLLEADARRTEALAAIEGGSK